MILDFRLQPLRVIVAGVLLLIAWVAR